MKNTTLTLAALIGVTSLVSAAQIVEYDWETQLAPLDKIGPTFSNGNASGSGNAFLSSGSIDGGNAITFTESGWATAGDTSSEFKITTDFTVTLWVNLSSNSDDLDRLIDTTNSNDAISGASGWRLLLKTNNDVVLQANGTGGNVINNTFTGLQAVQVDDWSFVALRYDTDGNATVTVLSESQLGDGDTIVASNSASVAADGAMSYGALAAPRLGVNQGSNNSRLNGSLDLVRLYDTALTDAELYTSFSTIPEPSAYGLLAGCLGFAVAMVRRR